MDYSDNPQLQLAYDFIQYTNRNVFLTGRAGTGKTTFLKRIKQLTPKRMVVLAPTGVAAINAGGMTIHSFFQLPFGPFLPGYAQAEGGKNKYKFSKRKIDIIRTLDLLVIDEISMVRADLLDAIDDVLRRYRGNQQPFGGVQLLMIGDLHQLAPVVKDDEWDLLRDAYPTMYFFGSNALRQTDYVVIELKQIYRQTSQHFIDILNRVRNNTADAAVFAELDKRYRPDFEPKDKDGYITLTTHNFQSNDINQGKLKKLKSKLVKFEAEISGNFPEQMYPTEYQLELKEGAQVMFVKNDPSPEKRFYNGKIGRIVNIEDGKVYVDCGGADDTIEVVPAEWTNASYKIDEQTKEITEVVDGTFRQYPLKLAWAITIHKSQGLTFDRVIIDAAQAFSHGQVYVALSRCKTLEGIVLSSRLGSGCLIGDEQVTRFNHEVEQSVVDEAVLNTSKVRYEVSLIADLFDCTEIYQEMLRCNRIFQKNSGVIIGRPDEKLAPVLPRLNSEVLTVAAGFGRQIEQIIGSGVEGNTFLQERISKGCDYFITKIGELLEPTLEEITFTTDNAEVEKEADDSLKKLRELTGRKKLCLNAMKDSFEVQKYLKTRAMSALQDIKPKKVSRAKSTQGDNDSQIENVQLFNMLRDWRNSLAKDADVPAYVIMHQKTLVEISASMPDTISDLIKVKGVGKSRANKYGVDIIEMVRRYKKENGMTVEGDIFDGFDDLKPAKKEPKIDTKLVTRNMFVEDGLTVEQIAKKRSLTISTIVNHLCHYVAQGEIEPADIMTPESVEAIADYLATAPAQGVVAVHEALKGEYTYDEIRLVMAWIKANG
ncbi:MAG: helix-turn-helix domain-containing protein [Salinivirgaceae bacterium]|nr:helix-turn-helix domain-containing protein [Salinivirgaceae bacterium]